jgi:hypothetical protein
MDRANLLVAATLLLLLVLPICASGEATIPYVNIKEPLDGQTVPETTELVVVAEGYDLRNPTVSISGVNTGIAFPLQGCVYTKTEITNESVEPGVEYPVSEYPPTQMYCKTKIDLSGFSGQKVKLSVSVTESGRTLTDSVGLYVSGQCA